MTLRISRSAVARLSTALAVVAGLLFIASPAAAHRCAGSASSLSLRGFAQPQQPYFYFTPEHQNGTFVVGGAIDRGNAFASYDTPPGSPLPATAGADYTRVNGTIQFENNVNDCLAVQQSRQVPVTNDSVVDAAGVEELLVDIDVQNASSGVSLVPMYILDDEGSIRARFPEPAQSSISEPQGSSGGTTKVPVLRGGSGPGSVTFSINDPGNDVSPDSGTVNFSDGFGQITISVTNDTVDEPNETVQITLSGSGGATVEGDNTFSLTILDNDSGGGGGDTLAPNAWFHHPKHGERYRRGVFGADTLHLFAAERPTHIPGRLANGRLGLRKKLTSGNCRWWRAGSWRSGPCGSIQWLNPTEFIPEYTNAKSLYTYTQYPSLRPSVGTNIRNYTVFGKVQDVDGNVSPLQRGDNKNTFEVTRN
jgi:hypothetical protein